MTDRFSPVPITPPVTDWVVIDPMSCQGETPGHAPQERAAANRKARLYRVPSTTQAPAAAGPSRLVAPTCHETARVEGVVGGLCRQLTQAGGMAGLGALRGAVYAWEHGPSAAAEAARCVGEAGRVLASTVAHEVAWGGLSQAQREQAQALYGWLSDHGYVRCSVVVRRPTVEGLCADGLRRQATFGQLNLRQLEHLCGGLAAVGQTVRPPDLGHLLVWRP